MVQTDSQGVSGVHVHIVRVLVAELLGGDDYVRVDGEWRVGDGDVEWTACAVDLPVDLTARIVMVNRRNEMLELE